MDDLVKPYQQRFGLQDATLSHIDHEEGIVAAVYQVTLLSGEKRILKICQKPADYFNEIYFLRNLINLPVPRVFQKLPPDKEINGAILMEYIPGKLLQKEDFNQPLLYEIGRQLAYIHQHHAAGYGNLTKPDELEAVASHYFSSKFEEVFSECKDHLSKTVSENCYQYYIAHQHLLDNVDGPCFTHRDFRPGNIIVKDDELQGIIDWSSARGGFAEEDFCPIEHGEWQMGPEYKSAFLEGYDSVRSIPAYKSVMSLLRLCRALNVMGFTLKNGSWKSNNEKIYSFNYEFIEALMHKPTN